jgi:hypothetical protein
MAEGSGQADNEMAAKIAADAVPDPGRPIYLDEAKTRIEAALTAEIGLVERLDDASSLERTACEARDGADWPGLKPADLHEGRDPRPTCDLQVVLKGLLRDHLRVDERVLASAVFPDSAAVVPMAGLVG